MKKLKYFYSNISLVYLPSRSLYSILIYLSTTTMNPFNLEQDFNAEHLELNFDTVFEDFLNETDTVNDDFNFVIGLEQEDTITHIIQLDLFNELDILNGLNYHDFDLVVNNDRLTLEELEPLEQDAEPALLFCNIDYDNITDIHVNEDEDEDEDIEEDTQEQEQEQEDDDDDLLQYILDNNDFDLDVIPYDCPVEADAFYAD